MALFSFNDPPGKSNVAWHGFTLDAWLHPFAVPGLFDVVRTSVVIAFLSTIVATALGTLIALALVRYQLPRVGLHEHADLPAAGDAGDRAGRLAADAVRGHRPAAVLPDELPDDPDRAHHVQHQLRRRDRARTPVRLRPQPRGGGDGPRRQRVDDVLEGDLPADPAGPPGRRPAGVQPVDRRLRDHELHRRPDVDVPDLHLGLGARGRPVQVNVIGTAFFVIAVGFVAITTLAQSRANRPPRPVKPPERRPPPPRPSPPARSSLHPGGHRWSRRSTAASPQPRQRRSPIARWCPRCGAGSPT